MLQYVLVVAIYSSSAGLSLEIPPPIFSSRDECEVLAKVFDARATREVSVETKCIGVPKNSLF